MNVAVVSQSRWWCCCCKLPKKWRRWGHSWGCIRCRFVRCNILETWWLCTSIS